MMRINLLIKKLIHKSSFQYRIELNAIMTSSFKMQFSPKYTATVGIKLLYQWLSFVLLLLKFLDYSVFTIILLRVSSHTM